MKIYIVFIALLMSGEAQKYYDSRYDYYNIDYLVQNPRLLKKYLNCFLNSGPCTPIGRDFKLSKNDLCYCRGDANTAKHPLILKKLSWVIRGHFQIIGVRDNHKTGKKTCYMKLSPNLDPQSVVYQINHATFGQYKVVARHSKELPIKLTQNMKPKVLPERLRHRMRIPFEQSPKEVLQSVLGELVTEMAFKYTGLLNLSKKTNHQLMDNICSMYGEPHLPNRNQLASYFKQIHAKRIRKMEKLFNLMCFRVTRDHYIKALPTDGTVVANCKLIIRSSDLPKYKIPESITKKLCALPSSRPTQKEVEPEENWEEW